MHRQHDSVQFAPPRFAAARFALFDGEDSAGAGAGGGEGDEGGEGAGDGGAAAPAKTPAKLGWKDALAQVREAIGATKGADDPARAGAAAVDTGIEEVAAGEGETPEQIEERLAGMEPDERAAEEQRMREALDNDPLIIDLGPLREGEEPIRIAAEDQAMADHIRSLKNRAQTYDASMRIREEAEAFRAQADEMRYEVKLDPGGFLLENLRDQNGAVRIQDAQHIARVLLTQPGVLDSMKDWVTALAAHPEALQQEARLANADRLERNAKVKPLVERARFENQNARQCVRAAYTAVDKLVPAWDQSARDSLVNDVIRDLQDVQRSEKVSVTDPKRVGKLVESRLSRFGVALNSGKGGAGGAGAGRPGSKTPGRTGPSGQKLVETDNLRRRAAGPGPGAGSPAARIPAPPAGTKLTGKNNVFDHLRRAIPGLRRAPQ